jgi:hypothetical protein
MDDDYTRGEVIGFVGAPLLLMVPPVAVPFLVFAFMWVAAVWDMLGLSTVVALRRR